MTSSSSFDHDQYLHDGGREMRFTIREPAREVLHRLRKLNHERYAEEVAQGLHKKKGRVASGGGRGKKKAAGKPRAEGATLFDMGENDE